jgi:TrmH family RNA methyltransferase
MDAGVQLDAVFVETSVDGRADIAALVDRAGVAGVDVWELPATALARLTDVVHPPGVAAIARWRSADLVAASATSSILVLAGVADPGNAGTLLRCGEAAGFSTAVFCGGAVDPTNPKCVRASAGALFHTAIAVRDTVPEVLDELGMLGYRRVATRLSAELAYDRADLTGPIAVILGNEAHGLPADLAAVDEVVSIPLVGRSESLNVAMAGAVVCFEALRQRRAL